MDKQNPHQVRIDVRERQYPNTLAEREAVREIDDAVFDRVRLFEKISVESAQKHKAEAQERVNASLALIEQLRAEIAEPLRRGEPLTPELAQRYEALANEAGQARANLSRAIAESEWHENRCRDPYAEYIRIMDAWPILRPALT